MVMNEKTWLMVRHTDRVLGFVGGSVNKPMPITDAKHRSDSWLVYRGKENYKIEGTSEKFRCLVFSFIEREDGKETELIKFFITDDDNHMPVRLDMNLSFGSAKVYLRAYQGIRNPLTSKLR